MKKYTIVMFSILLTGSVCSIKAMEEEVIYKTSFKNYPKISEQDLRTIKAIARDLKQQLNVSTTQSVIKRQQERPLVQHLLYELISNLEPELLHTKVIGERHTLSELADFISERYWLQKESDNFYSLPLVSERKPTSR